MAQLSDGAPADFPPETSTLPASRSYRAPMDAHAAVMRRSDPLVEPVPETARDDGAVPDEGARTRGSRTEDITLEEANARYAGVSWPHDDRQTVDFGYLHGVMTSTSFELTAEVLDQLLASNQFEPYAEQPLMAFALRGARLATGFSAEEQQRVPLVVSRPDHRTLQCVVGFYHRQTRRLSVFSGSTVPCRAAIYCTRFQCPDRENLEMSNLLPTGMYTYFVWRHSSLPVALRLASGNIDENALEKPGRVTVLRNRDELEFTQLDPFVAGGPFDNVHCTYYLGEAPKYGAEFSSNGCITVRGSKAPGQEWAKFVNVLETLALGSRVDLMLLTGKDAALASDHVTHEGPGRLTGHALQALRQGSRGEAVARLQEKLGLDKTGFFGATTADRLTTVQRRLRMQRQLSATADGICSRQFEAVAGWQILQGRGIPA